MDINLLLVKKRKYFSCPKFPVFGKSNAFWNVPRLFPFVLERVVSE